MLGEDCDADASVVPEAQYASLQCKVEVRMCQQAASNIPRPCQRIQGDGEKWSAQSVQLWDTVPEAYLTILHLQKLKVGLVIHFGHRNEQKNNLAG